MLRHPPKYTYSGLTVVLSNPSRADKNSLLCAKGGTLFGDCLKPDINIFQCDVRLKEDRAPLIDGTKCVILLGESAAQLWQKTEYSLKEIRGLMSYLPDYPTIPSIATFFPQDAADIKNYEAEFNKQADELDEDDDDDETELGEKRRHGKTKRKNYSFWLRKDIEHAKLLLSLGGVIPSPPITPNYIIYPSSDSIIHILTSTKNEFLYIDIETDPCLNILCFSFSFSSKPQDIYVVPCLLPDYTWAYSSLPFIYKAITKAFRDNITVAHNGAAFDFFVFAYKLHISIGPKCYDTMLAQHRCFPEVEKSLGHGISLWCPYMPFHKDEGGGGYSSLVAARRMWEYCGKDVFTMYLIHQTITSYASIRPGLSESIKQANDSIRPYLITSLQGIEYDKQSLDNTVKENDRLMMQYLRMLRILIGKDSLETIRGSGKSSMPGSNVQCVRYFHDMLGYPVMARSKPNAKGIQNPSLAKKAMFKLRLKYENPCIDICIAYRELSKESGSLGFIPWKEDNDSTIQQEEIQEIV